MDQQCYSACGALEGGERIGLAILVVTQHSDRSEAVGLLPLLYSAEREGVDRIKMMDPAMSSDDDDDDDEDCQ